MELEVTAVVLIGLALTGMSLLIDYAPKVAPWFENLAFHRKRQFVLGVCVVLVLGITGLDCAGLLATSISCAPFNWISLTELLFNLVVAIGGMTAFHMGTKPNSYYVK